MEPPLAKKPVGWENLLQEEGEEEEAATVEVVQKVPEEVAPSVTKPQMMYNMTADTNGNMQIDKVRSQGLKDAVPVFEQKKREYFFFFFFGRRKKKKNI